MMQSSELDANYGVKYSGYIELSRAKDRHLHHVHSYAAVLVHYRFVGAHLARRQVLGAYLASPACWRWCGRRAFGASAVA